MAVPRARRCSGPVLACLLLAPVLGAGCGDDAPSVAEARAEQVGDAAAAAGLPEEVVEFLADAAAGDGTFRVTYEVAAPDGGEPQRVTITQRPPERRVDIEQPGGAAQSTIGTAEGSHQCSRPGAEEPWTCQPSPEAPADGVFDDGAVAALAEALGEQAGSFDFAIETRTILGVEARCLVTTRRPDVEDPALGAGATLCTSPQGARLLTETPSGTLRAVEYTTTIPDDAFALPDGDA